MPSELPVPPFHDPEQVGEVWRVPYEERFRDAEAWAREHDIGPAAGDAIRAALVLVDVQNTFCTPGFELFVAGRSGTGALDDSRRLCSFVYRNLARITQIVPTLDTHDALQIFHSIFLVGPGGEHPGPFTLVSAEDVRSGRWRASPAAADGLGLDPGYLQEHLLHYAETLEAGGKYSLTVWPHHAMLGGIGHALVSAVEQAVFFHTVARASRPDFQLKGNDALTEHYSMLGPEVSEDAGGEPLGRRNRPLIERLLRFDAVIVAGQAKSHCVAWTIRDLLDDPTVRERGLAEKVYLLEDCTSPVVVPGAVDYTEEAEAAFARFAQAGAHIVSSTEAVDAWPGPLGG